MTDYSTMPDPDLARAVAEVCGWKPERKGCPLWPHNHVRCGCDDIIPHPAYPTDMNACLASGGPVGWLRARGLEISFEFVDGHWETDIWKPTTRTDRTPVGCCCRADTLPRALCEAFMQVTEGK